MTLGWIAAGSLSGAVAGSFLATVAIRWSRGESVVRGRSRCDRCGIAIAPHRLVPLFSYAQARGRCVACAMPIDPRQPLLELACALIGGLALGIAPGPDGACGALFGWLLATLALIDRDHFWLPDALVLPLGALGLAAAAGTAPPLPDRLIGAAGGLLFFMLVGSAYRRLRGQSGLGDGDAKLLGAIGAWLGWQILPWVVLVAAAIGLGWSLLAMARGRRVRLDDRLPLGSLLALAAWPLWLAQAGAARL